MFIQFANTKCCRDYPFPLGVLCSPIQLTVYLEVLIWGFLICSTSLFLCHSLLIFCFYYYRFTVSLKSGSLRPRTLFFLFHAHFVYLDSLRFFMNFRLKFSVSSDSLILVSPTVSEIHYIYIF